MAAAAKLAVAQGTLTTTTRHHHRVSTTVAVSSATPPITASQLSRSLQHKQEEAIAAASTSSTTEVPPPPLACMWQEIQGAGDWRGLVEPLHPLLRAEIVRYAELVAACYRALDLDTRSKRHLSCKHGKKRMLEAAAAGMHMHMHGGDGAGDGYTVTRHIYAAAPVPDVVAAVFGGGCRRSSYSCSKSRSRWIGYVAVASDREAARLGRRDIVVSFRGTVTASEWLANFMSGLAPARFDPGDPRPDVLVESGFLSLYTSDTAADVSGGKKFTGGGSCRNQLLSEISRLVAKHGKDGEEMSITLVGHSMGSSLAILLGYDLAELGLNSYPNNNGGGSTPPPTIPITVYSFAGPRVGNLEFKNRCDELGVKVLRVVNVRDPVTKIPGVFFNEGARVLAGRYELPWSKACYVHVGVEVSLDFFEPGDIGYVHDIQAYIDQLLLTKCAAAADGDHINVAVGSDDGSIMDEEGGVNGGRVVVASMFESWRWQMAAIRAGEFMQALGI